MQSRSESVQLAGRPRSVVSQLVPPPPELAEIERREIEMMGNFLARHAHLEMEEFAAPRLRSAIAQCRAAGERAAATTIPHLPRLVLGLEASMHDHGSMMDLGNWPAGPAGWDSGSMAVDLRDRAVDTASRPRSAVPHEGGGEGPVRGFKGELS